MEIRDQFKNEIFASLNFDIFRFEDFEIDINSEDNSGSIIKISYDKCFIELNLSNNQKNNQRRTFDGLHVNNQVKNCFIKYLPGKFFAQEEEEMDINEFITYKEQKIHDWLLRVKEEMLNPLDRRFITDNIQKFREEIENKLEGIEDGYFTNEEGIELREKLDQLENIILNRDSQEEMQSEIAKMKEEIEFLKATVNTLTKKKWLKNALVKMWSWGQKEENRKLIESGFEAVKAISQIDIPKV